MEQEFLLKFLEIGAIDLKGDDTKLERLRSTAKDLSAALRKAPSKTACFTMVAADPNIAATDPTVEEAMASLRKQWETVANAFARRPVGILRAILLDAIMQAARSDDAIAVAFVNTARNALVHAETANESEIWREAVSEIEKKVDARAEAEWATPETITVDPFQYTAPSPVSTSYEAPTVNKSELRENIYSAAGPWGASNSNQYHSSQPQHWAPIFADKMSVAIAEVLNGMAEELAPAPVDLSGPLSQLAKAVTTHVDKALASFSGATAGLQRRTNLLWWKEALYSPSVHASYLDLPLFEASALMALDLHEQVPTYSPASVSAFLREAIRCLPAEKDDQDNGERDVASLVHDARTAAFMQPFRALATQYVPEPVGRGPLLSLIGHTQNSGVIEATTLRALVGVDASTKMTPSEWGTYLFRELQSARATTKSPTKQVKKK
ncbi:GTPase-associated system all-helical protein GASH [Alcaligenes phenolicus]|uniref:GTPase-associated system all-helical protein GASH n=1 Tax=Alcaligenes phenolicus TaxID=232846 RepID=UPI002CD01A82|nr:GTPase-associated system all-helical protein GASH [Alcaligenes phenolicus]HRO18845.1 GTPase-associated system all-helical protein GASH [Alcaligenes phenolicus]HRP14682.1 GTPase-associated system all-helical protein GASH [Alcaligenes phenolicus]